LQETGFVEGRNAAIEYRYASGEVEALPEPAAELVRRRVNVIVAGHPAGTVAKAATATIPIVFVSGTDPVRIGLVASINRPGGNATGVSMLGAELETKRIGLLRELVPKTASIGALIDATSGGGGEFQMHEVKEAARRLGLSIEAVTVEGERDLDNAFATLARERVDALLIGASTLFNAYRDRVVALATRLRIPTVYELREFAEAGGLMTYAPSITDAFRQAGVYTGRVLKGDKPADLPVLLPAKFELVLNLSTARALGLTIPETLLAIADEVIQ
jgi:putative ABC transport system substrate-binding protein